MYCLSNFCYLCLSNDKNLINVSSLDNNKTSILEKLLYTIDDLVLVNSNDIKICKVCCHILRVSHEFKKRCIQNNVVFLGYIKQLTEYSNVYANTKVNVDANFIPKPKNKSKTINKKRVNIIDITSTDDEDSLNDAKTNIINTLLERQIIETLNEPQKVTEYNNSVQNCGQLKQILQTDTVTKTNIDIPKPKNKSKIINKKRGSIIDVTSTDDEDFVKNNSLFDAKSNIINTLIERQIIETLNEPQKCHQSIPESNLKETKIIETKINALLKNYTEQIKQKLIEDNTAKILLKNTSSENTATQTSEISEQDYVLFDPEDSNLELQPLFDDEIDAPLIVVKTEPVEPVPTVEIRNTLDVTAPEVVPTEKQPDIYQYLAHPTTNFSFAYLSAEQIPTDEMQNAPDDYSGQPRSTVNFAYVTEPQLPTVEMQNALDVPAPTVFPTEKEPDFYSNSADYFAHPRPKVSFADYQNWTQRTKVRTVVVPLEHLVQCDVKKKPNMDIIDDINSKIQQIDNIIEPKQNILETYLTDPKVRSKNVDRTTSKQDTDLENLILKSNTEYNAKKVLQKEKRRLEKIKEHELKQKLSNQPLPTIKEAIINEKISQLITEPFVKPVETTVDFEAEIGSTKIINEPQMHPILTKLLKKTNQHDITSKLDSDPNLVLQLEHCYTKLPGDTTLTEPKIMGKRKRKSVRSNPRRKKAKAEQEITKSKYMCHICFQRFTDLHDLNVHVISKHDCKKLFKCEFCPRIYTNLSTLRRHCTIEHKIPCSLTDPEVGNVNTSRNEDQAAKSPQHNLKMSQAFYKCNLCCKIYSAFKSIQMHFVEAHFEHYSRGDLEMYSEISINELESLNSI